MTIFMIPSWYPTKESPVTGRFFKEQALIYARQYTEDTLIISRWGQGEFILNLLSPWEALKKLFFYLKAHRFSSELSDNVIEFYTPALELRPRHCIGDIFDITKKNICNFKTAQKYYGKIDVIHAHVVFPAGVIAMQLSKRFHVPYVITEHMGPFPFPFFLNSQKRLQERLYKAYQEASNVMAVSSFLKDEMAVYGAKAHSVIPDFIDDSFFTLRHAPKGNCFNIVVLGRMTKMKGIDIFIRAFALAFASDHTVNAKLGGVGEDMAYCKTLCQELGIETQVDFLGALDPEEVKRVLHESHILVNASLYETFSVVVSEAFCSGIPVVTTACGGPAVMCHEENSIMVKAQEEVLAEAMKTMRANFGRYDAQYIRDRHLASFGKKCVTKALRDVYRNAIKKYDANSRI